MPYMAGGQYGESMIVSLYRKIKTNINEDGLIVSSSGYLVRNMLEKIDFSRPLKILELGSGRGAFTREIIRRMNCESELHVCEIKAEYNIWIEALMAASPEKNITLHNCCVTRMMQGSEEYDVIVSSLPLKNFTRLHDDNRFLLEVIEGFHRSLKTGGSLVQFQYFRSNKGDIERVFGKRMDAVSFVPLNILPAFVYNMTKPVPGCEKERL